MKTKTKTTLGFFGAGKMAEGILAAAAVVPGFDPSQVLMAERIPERAAELEKKYGVRTTPNAADVARAARVIFLAVRPQDVAALAADVKPILTKRHLVVSIAAGKSLSTLRKALGRDVRLVRVMPNLALRAREGMCAICPAKNATPADVRKVAKILNAAGRTAVLEVRLDERVGKHLVRDPVFLPVNLHRGPRNHLALVIPSDRVVGTEVFLPPGPVDAEHLLDLLPIYRHTRDSLSKATAAYRSWRVRR